MSFVLIKIDQEPFKQGLPCKEIPMALSESRMKLEEFCEVAYGQPIGEPALFNFDPYYIIRISKVLIL